MQFVWNGLTPAFGTVAPYNANGWVVAGKSPFGYGVFQWVATGSSPAGVDLQGDYNYQANVTVTTTWGQQITVPNGLKVTVLNN